jgi:hypothetical protein
MAFQTKNQIDILLYNQSVEISVQITPAHQIQKKDVLGRLFCA